LEKIVKIYLLLRPKRYNTIISLIVGVGLTLLSKPFWLDLLNLGIESTNENFKNIYIPVIGKYDWLIGLFIIIIALIYNTYNRLLELKFNQVEKAEYLNIVETKCSSFYEVCKLIFPILKDNQYIFKTVGPNSGAEFSDLLRTDMTMWYKYRSETIIPNNEKIKSILIENKSLFDREKSELADQMIMHIDAVQEHTINEEFDYSQHRFPTDFCDLITKECYNSSVNSAHLLKRKKWVKKRLLKQVKNEWYLFGSSLFIPEKANDFDIVILFDVMLNKRHLKDIEILKMDFKLKFKSNLHLTPFQKNEKVLFEEFISYNTYKLKGNG
jgi:hypothetical protein